MQMEYILVIGNSHICQKVSKILIEEKKNFLYLPGENLSLNTLKSIENLPYKLGNYYDDEFLLQNNIQKATSVIIAEKSDDANIATTLLIRDLNPSTKIIVEFLSNEISNKITQEIPNCYTLSASSHSAPTFASAAIFRYSFFSFNFENKLYSIVNLPLEKTIGLEQETKLNFESSYNAKILFLQKDGFTLDEKDIDIFPQQGNLFFFIETNNLENLKQHIPKSIAKCIVHKDRFKLTVDRFIVYLAIIIILVVASATCYFHYNDNLNWINSVYFVITTLSTVGYGDFSLKEASMLSKTIGIILMLSGLSLTALFFAIITNIFIQKRTDYIEGRKKYKLKNHIIVCGLGKVGLKIIDNLLLLNQKVLVIENSQNNLILKELQRRNVPFMIANARDQKTLFDANIHHAKSIICAINDDLLCLEIGLMARTISPDLKVVLRIFDESLALRVQKFLNINLALSTSTLTSRSLLAYSTRDNLIAAFPKIKIYNRIGIFEKNDILPNKALKLVQGIKDLVIFSEE